MDVLDHIRSAVADRYPVAQFADALRTGTPRSLCLRRLPGFTG